MSPNKKNSLQFNHSTFKLYNRSTSLTNSKLPVSFSVSHTQNRIQKKSPGSAGISESLLHELEKPKQIIKINKRMNNEEEIVSI